MMIKKKQRKKKLKPVLVGGARGHWVAHRVNSSRILRRLSSSAAKVSPGCTSVSVYIRPEVKRWFDQLYGRCAN